MTLFLPKNFPRSEPVLNYVVGHNETHMALPLDYVSLLNHHESANTRACAKGFDDMYFEVRMCFRAISQAFMHAKIRNDTRALEYFPKATKDIAAGQELFVRYGGAQWFARKNVTIDYARTMWRPELHPMPCRRSLYLATGADGQRSFAVVDAIRSGTVLETSLCKEVSLVVVDQFPFLWDFVLTGETENVAVTL